MNHRTLHCSTVSCAVRHVVIIIIIRIRIDSKLRLCCNNNNKKKREE